MPAAWTNPGAPAMLNSVSIARVASRPAGATIQPRRHPVMDQVLEKVLTEMTRSSGFGAGQGVGAYGWP